MRTIMMWLILTFVCCGLALATNGIQPQNFSGGEGLFIPPMDDTWNDGGNDVWSNANNDSLRWQPGKQTGGIKSWSASPRKPIATKSVKTEESAPGGSANASTGDSDMAWLPNLPQPWAVVLIALGGLVAAMVPAALVGRWMRARRVRRGTKGGDRLVHRLRSRPSVQTALAASLIQTQLRSDKFAEAAREEEIKKARRAA